MRSTACIPTGSAAATNRPKASTAFLEANNAATPLERPGTVDEVAPLVVFIIPDESSFIGGAEIPVGREQWAHGGAKSLSDTLQVATTTTLEGG
jgi:NAD(P)-dependent dehydrogenase (short-subunit alcohol dehydrogenase family)